LKQEIVCVICKDKLKKLFPNDTPFPGEHVKFVSGTANKNYICDHCGKQINENKNCWAFSIWAENSLAGYYEWEKEYLELEGG